MIDLDVHLEAIATGDSVAFARWVAAAEAPLRLSLRSFAARVDVEVVVQESLLRAWQLAPRIQRDGGGNSLLRFALRTARNLAIDEARRRQRDGATPSESDMPSVAPIEPDPLLRETVQRCMTELPARPAKAFQLRLFEQASRSDLELAGELGMKLNTFLKNFGRARQLLLECLQRHGVELSWERAR